MNRKLLSIAACCSVGCACVVAPTPTASAAELLPYSPPPQTFGRKAQPIQRPQATQLSGDELRNISRFAAKVRSMPPTQRSAVRDGLVRRLSDAASRGDLRRVQYYSELLRQIDGSR